MAKITSTEEWIEAAVKHLDKIKDSGERYNFVHSLIFNLALYGGYNDYEMIGILRWVEADLIEAARDMHCDGDCDNCDRDDGDE